MRGGAATTARPTRLQKDLVWRQRHSCNHLGFGDVCIQCSVRHSCNHLGFGDVCINSVLRDTPAIIWGSATCVSTVFRATLLQSFGVRRRVYQQCSHRWTHAAVLGWQAGGEARTMLGSGKGIGRTDWPPRSNVFGYRWHRQCCAGGLWRGGGERSQ